MIAEGRPCSGRRRSCGRAGPQAGGHRTRASRPGRGLDARAPAMAEADPRRAGLAVAPDGAGEAVLSRCRSRARRRRSASPSSARAARASRPWRSPSPACCRVRLGSRAASSSRRSAGRRGRAATPACCSRIRTAALDPVMTVGEQIAEVVLAASAAAAPQRWRGRPSCSTRCASPAGASGSGAPAPVLRRPAPAHRPGRGARRRSRHPGLPTSRPAPSTAWCTRHVADLLDALVRERGLTLVFVTHDIALASSSPAASPCCIAAGWWAGADG